MAENGEIENLRFLCYYHLIISSLSSSLISFDSFFVTDSDRRKSVIELEKIKNYYEKSLLLENSMKQSTAVIDTKTFEERMNINYQFNYIINEFWGYNEIKKYYDHNKELCKKIVNEKYKQPNNNIFDIYEEESLSDLDIYNNLKFDDINDVNDKDNKEFDNNKISNKEIMNDELNYNDNVNNDIKIVDMKNKKNYNIIHKINNDIDLKTSKKKIKENKDSNKNIIINKDHKKSHKKNLKMNHKNNMNDYKNYNNANNIRCNYKINRNNLDIQSINKPKIKILNATINSPISCKESRNLTYSNLLKLTSLTNKHEKIKYIKKECSNSKY